MPKDRRVTSSSFDRSMVSPYSCCSKFSDRTDSKTCSPHIGNVKEWEEARCPICMDHPHNAVLLICSSRVKGCRPFICDTSYRHSNCLDQFRKSSSSPSSSSFPPQEAQSQLVCPLCRGEITGWDVVHIARKFMNSKTRNCSLETCGFNGNYAELRKHARVEHPSARPTEASPTRQSNWTMLEQRMEMEDALAHQWDIEFDWDGWHRLDEWGESGLWSDGSFFDFPSGMSDIEDGLVDEMFSGLSFSFLSLYSSFTEEELMDSGSSRSTISVSTLDNQVENDLMSISRSSGNEATTVSRSRSSHSRENGSANVRSRSDYRGENGSANVRSRSDYRGENGSTVSGSRQSYGGENAPGSSRTRPSYPRENGSISRSRSSYRSENGTAGSRARSSFRGEYTQPSSRARSRYDRLEVGRSGRRSGSRRSDGSSSRHPRSDFGRREE